MKMKTKYFFVLMVALFMGTQVMNAQDEQGKERKHGRKRMTMEQMADMQASKIVADLGLDDKTAAKFTEVYKKYMAEQNEVRKEFAAGFAKRDKMGEKKDGERVKVNAPTDEQVDKMMRDRFKQSRKMLDIREKYYDEFRKFLSPKQVQKVFDKGMMNPGMFNREMNRRAHMRTSDGKHSSHK
jgi:hypothetical protein